MSQLAKCKHVVFENALNKQLPDCLISVNGKCVCTENCANKKGIITTFKEAWGKDK